MNKLLPDLVNVSLFNDISNSDLSARIKQDFSKSDLAKYLDVSRPSLIREFKKLQDQKLLRLQDSYIEVLDLDRLLAVLIEKC